MEAVITLGLTPLRKAVGLAVLSKSSNSFALKYFPQALELIPLTNCHCISSGDWHCSSGPSKPVCHRLSLLRCHCKHGQQWNFLEERRKPHFLCFLISFLNFHFVDVCVCAPVPMYVHMCYPQSLEGDIRTLLAQVTGISETSDKPSETWTLVLTNQQALLNTKLFLQLP